MLLFPSECVFLTIVVLPQFTFLFSHPKWDPEETAPGGRPLDLSRAPTQPRVHVDLGLGDTSWGF